MVSKNFGRRNLEFLKLILSGIDITAPILDEPTEEE